ncbi:predicted protein [Aspergillus terreus NIH2624]|uniref:Transcription factor tazR n=1 Tax=Aspergillus terreus (strain NIH 2624 / FGSC A1156) TaxID=341663 RepID=TAZR_ASPTN|nr:uncharacterized protein ATEG_03445 [Aspergillus terreus NIH2624]Q0CS89.1 RecName: Full=Transcription factor tazR; AltName: Full=Azaphilone biosynthesis cluster protein R [Aspergillus terreus NIH2624]EAU36719.1 predicted protein [Aspergillus terreus NIH2624]
MSPSLNEPERLNRQAQGLACNECRARKLRCDRVRPTCGTCESLGVTCTPNSVRQPRGPRKGYLKTLQSRISALERQWNGQQKAAGGSPGESPPCSEGGQTLRAVSESTSDGVHDEDHANGARPPSSQSSIEQPILQPTVSLDGISALHGFAPVNSPFAFALPGTDPSKTVDLFSHMECFPSMPTKLDPRAYVPQQLTPNSTMSNGQFDLPTDLSVTSEFQLPELMKADLSHLYFDRVHPFAPILNKRRYFARAARPVSEQGAMTCLQHAMWTLAAWLGSQFKHIQKDLYIYTRGLLEKWELNMHPGNPPIELAQARLFLAIYEIMQVNYERGWLSAGRCFRLIQLMKLHEIDVPDGISESGISFGEIEERRRTFWMAYSLDRFINLINKMPLTLNEQVIFTRLPAPEGAFQRERPVQTQFLSEFMAGDDDLQIVSPFSACIVVMTISGRCLSHQQQCMVERAYGGMPQDFITRHQWLEGILMSKGKAIVDCISNDLDDELTDPMLLFTNMAAHATTLLLGMTMQTGLCNYESLISGFEERATEAAQKILHLCQRLNECGYFKVHPFTPIPLVFCAEWAQGRKNQNPAFEPLHNSMLCSLRDLSVVNMLAETCLARLNDSNPQMETDMSKSQS